MDDFNNANEFWRREWQLFDALNPPPSCPPPRWARRLFALPDLVEEAPTPTPAPEVSLHWLTDEELDAALDEGIEEPF